MVGVINFDNDSDDQLNHVYNSSAILEEGVGKEGVEDIHERNTSVPDAEAFTP